MMRKLSRWLMLFYVGGIAHAAPPLDVTLPEAKNSRVGAQKAKPRDSDFEMLDVNDAQLDLDRDVAEVLYDVMGRARPSRDGKPILRCIKYDQVRFLKFSSDHKWAAIQSLRSGQKAWIPITAFQHKKFKKRGR